MGHIKIIVFLLGGLLLAACGSLQPEPTATPTFTVTSSPTATYTHTPTLTPTLNPTLTATPMPRVTFTLSALSDHSTYSGNLGPLSTGQSFEVSFRVMQIDQSSGEEFGHAVEFWLSRSESTTSADFAQDSIALSFIWSRDTDWVVKSRIPGIGYSGPRSRVQIALGQQRSVRISRRSDGVAGFFLDDSSVLTLFDSAALEYAFARVVGTTVDFSYVPLVSSVLRSVVVSPYAGAQPCEQRPSHAYRGGRIAECYIREPSNNRMNPTRPA